MYTTSSKCRILLRLFPLKLLFIFTFCFMQFEAKANKKFVFAYDANGNRITVTFQSTCNERLKDTLNTTDSTLKMDTLLDNALKEVKSVTSPSAYPNPVREYLNLSLPEFQGNAQLEIYDSNGNVVFKDEYLTTSQTIIKTCGLAAGTYTIIARYGSEKPFVHKMVKQ